MPLSPPSPAPRPSRSTSWWPMLALATLVLAMAAKPKAVDGPSPGSGTRVEGERTGGAASGDGHDAETPLEIPPRGWLDIAKRVFSEIGDDRVLAVAAGVTFYALLALFPAIAAFVSIYGLFANAAAINDQLASLKGVLPDGALSIIGDQVKSITAKPSSSLGFATVFGLLVSLWSANAGMKAMFDALNVVYKEKEKRSFIMLNLISLGFTLGAIVILLAAMAAVVVVPVLLNILGLASIGAFLLALARWPLLLVVIIVALAVLYRYGPSRPKAKWRWVSWGSAIAAVAWLIASLGFSFYVSRFGSYNATYGSLGAAIGFLTWVWISTIVVLIGAEIGSEMEHQTDRDTTAGPEKALGQRGATMADKVATAH